MHDNVEIPSLEEIFLPVKICFWLAGLPLTDAKITIRFFFLHFFIFLVDFQEILYFIPKLETADILEITSLIPCLITGIVALLKFNAIFLKRKQLFKLIKNITELHVKIVNDPNNLKVVTNDLIFLKRITKYYSLLNIALLSVYVLKDIIWISYVYIMNKEMVYPLPFAITFPVAIDNFLSWLLAYLQCSIGACICLDYMIGNDVLYYILTSQVCLNMSVISYQLENIKSDDISGLFQIVEYHRYVLELSNDLEYIFTGINFYNYLSASIQICVLGFDLLIADWLQLPQYILFLLSLLLQIFLMSIFGENIIRESERIGQAAYLSQWYNMNEKMKKILLFICARAMRPQKLTAYKFSVISYGTFSKIISSSWSYFTILNTVYTPPDKN